MNDEERRIAQRLGKLVRAARTARGWSQAQLAEAIDVSFGFVGLMERGERLPSLPTLIGMARHIHLSLDDLVGDAPDEWWADELLTRVRALSDQQRALVMQMLGGGALAKRPPARGSPTRRRRQR